MDRISLNILPVLGPNQVPYLNILSIWFSYLDSLLGFLTRLPYSGNLKRPLIQVPDSRPLIGLLIQVPNFGFLMRVLYWGHL